MASQVREKLGVSIDTAGTRKGGIKSLSLSIDLGSSGHYTLEKISVANSSRVATLDSCEVLVVIASI